MTGHQDSKGDGNMFSDYVFTDCMLVDVMVSHDMRDLQMKVEAFGLPTKGRRPKGLLSVVCQGISHLEVRINPEFWVDLAREYDTGGEDQRANEIVNIEGRDDGMQYSLKLDSDMLSLYLICKSVEQEFERFPEVS
jgi:hypothetical protein